MKKILLLVVMSLTTLIFVQAQEEANYKPAGGNFSMEVGFNPFGNNGTPVIGLGFKGRYAITERWYVRLNVPLTGRTNSFESEMYIPDLGVNVDMKNKTSVFGYSIIPGVEYHIGNLERLSPYFGAEIGFTHSITRERQKNIGGDHTVDILRQNMNQNGNIGMQLNVLAGFDWYITRNLFLGVEFGLGLNLSSTLKGKETVTIDNTTVINKFEDKRLLTTFGFAPNSLIRLGWVF